MEWLSLVADIVGITAAIFAGWQAYRLRQERKREQGRLDKKITVSLRSQTQKLVLPVELRRGETTRAEVLGRIGMLPLKDEASKRFSLPYLNTHEFLSNLNAIMEGDGDEELVIRCEEKEIDQFNLEKFQHLVSPL